MTGGAGLEQRYRRVLRLLPRYYRQQWEEDMVAAFLDIWLTGDPDDDEAILELCRPTWPEVASVITLAARLYLGGAFAPRRYFAWGQAVRCAILVVVLVHAVRRLDVLVLTVWTRHPAAWVPAPPASLVIAAPGGVWPAVSNTLDYVWIVVFVTLVFGHYRTARVIAVLAPVPDLAARLQEQFAGTPPTPFGSWAYWVLLDLAPVVAMAAFHRDAPSALRWRWLLALPVSYLLVVVPLRALQATGNSDWVPDFPGLCCILVTLACLAHVSRAWSRKAAGSGVWSLALVVLAAVAGAYRLVSLCDYLHDPHFIKVSLAELLILWAATALVTPDAARAQAPTTTSPPARPRWGDETIGLSRKEGRR